MSIIIGQDVCATCGQVVSDPLVAAQIVASGADPVVFDDIVCLTEYLARNTRLRPQAIAYVTDHLTGEWVVAATALYTRNLQLTTPRQSHIIAHGSITTQTADPAGRTGTRVYLKSMSLLDVPDGTR